MARLTKPLAAVTSLFALCAVTSLATTEALLVRLDSDADAALLAEHRIEPTRAGVTAFLHQLKKELAESKKAEALIRQLGDSKFRIREAAMQRLLEAPSLPLKALQQATTATDPEIASRAKRILSHPQVAARVAQAESRPWIGAAVCRTIRDRPIQGVTPVLFEVIPLLDDPELLDVACEAVATVASPDDLPLLRQSLASKDLNLRIAAIRGLGRAEAQLRGLIEDPEPRLALAVAHTLAERGERAVLPVLVRLASARDVHVRARSEQILRALTGCDFGFNPFLDPAGQKEQLAAWRNWAANQGRTARLNLPLRLAPLPEDLRWGLLLHYTFDQPVEGRLTDSSGQRRHGLLHNAHSFVAGVAGKALEVRGTGDMGDQGGHAFLPSIDFMALEQFTVALWVNERGMSDPHGEAYVVFGADRMVGLEDSLGISHFNDGIVFRVGGAVVSTPFDKADRNKWVHYALTFQDGRLRAYKDGRQVGEAKGRVMVLGKQAALGRHWWHHGAATSTRFIGAFDDLRVYRRALSPSQVELLRSSLRR
ncbi:MAG: hypothetical protein L0Z62_21360 [Gemmataceae bacterium]|nr:hypothetical protein [Gemmataceae bacterium]